MDPHPKPSLGLVGRLPLVSSQEQSRRDPLAPLTAPYTPTPGLVDTLQKLAGRTPHVQNVSTLGPDVLGEYRAHATPGQPVADTVLMTNAPWTQEIYHEGPPPGAKLDHTADPDYVLAHEFGHAFSHNPRRAEWYDALPAAAQALDGEQFSDAFARALENLRAGKVVRKTPIPLPWIRDLLKGNTDQPWYQEQRSATRPPYISYTEDGGQ